MSSSTKMGVAEGEGVIALGPWGGSGGFPWSYQTNTGITEIIIRYNGAIDSLSFNDISGNKSGDFGGTIDNASEKKININWPSEYLQKISGTFGLYNGHLLVTSLAFYTNNKKYGPFGNVSGEHFNVPISDDVVVGFYGRARGHIDAIGFYVKPAPVKGIYPLGPWGGSGGGPWSYKANGGITGIIIHHDFGVINSISFKDTRGFYSGRFGGDNRNEKIIDFKWPSEHLLSVNGTYGQYAGLKVITSISFITNVATYGPYGEANGDPFSSPNGGNLVVGFFGRAGDFVDALGVYVEPAN